MATHRSLHRPLALLASSISILKMNTRTWEEAEFSLVHPMTHNIDASLDLLQNTQLASLKAEFMNPIGKREA